MNSRVDLSMQYQRNPLVYAIKNTIGTGLVIGILESFLIAYTIQNALDTVSFLQLVLCTILVDGLIVGTLCGFIAGLLAPLIPVKYESDTHTWSVGIGGFLLYSWLLMPKMLLLLEQGQTSHAIGMLGCILIFSGCTWYNALYWFRRDFAKGVSFSWWPVATGISVLMLPVLLNIYHSRPFGNSEKTLSTDNNILVITVENLRFDAIQHMPKLQKFAQNALFFEDAISGVPDSFAANVSILTGIHALDNGALEGNITTMTMAHRLDKNNYATFGFFSNPQFARYSHKDNLSVFFDVYDAQCSFAFPSLQKIQIFSLLNWSPSVDQTSDACSSSKLGQQVVDWVSQSEAPSFTFVQLSDLSGITNKENYIAQLASLDDGIEQLIQGMDQLSKDRNLMVSVVGTSGVMLGEKDVTGPYGLHEEMIHVPLIIRPIQGKKSIDNSESSLVGTITKPVRIWDLYGTIMGQLNWDIDHKIIKSGELVKKSASSKFHGYNEILLHKEIVGGEFDWVVGYRAAVKNTDHVYKITAHPITKEIHIISVPDDPKEEQNLFEEQPKIYASTKSLLQDVMTTLPNSPSIDWLPSITEDVPAEQ